MSRLSEKMSQLVAADGRSVRQMARDLEIDVGYLSRLLSGSKPFHPKTLNKILAWLKVSGLLAQVMNHLGARSAGWKI